MKSWELKGCPTSDPDKICPYIIAVQYKVDK